MEIASIPIKEQLLLLKRKLNMFIQSASIPIKEQLLLDTLRFFGPIAILLQFL